MAEAKLTASSAAQSFMVRVNLVPFTGTIEGEKVVSGASRSATLSGLVLLGGNEYQAVVWGFSQDVQTPGPIVGPFNFAFNLASDDNFFIVPLPELPGPPTGFIRIPLRWCGLKGSPSIEDPGLLGLGTTDRVLINRHLLMNERIYVDQARIRFITGAREGGFPVIEGTDLEPDETNVGNITNPLTISSDPIRRAWNECRLEWRDKDPTVTGLIALNINRFVDGNRTPETSILGFAGTPDPNDLGQQLLEGVASVIDRTYFVPQRTQGIALDPNEKWLGHELGRALSLVHILPGNNLMDNVNVAEIKLRDATKGDPPPDQVGIIRSQALTQRIPID